LAALVFLAPNTGAVAVRVSDVRPDVPFIDNLRNLVVGCAVVGPEFDTDVPALEEVEEAELETRLSLSFSFLELGLGGGLTASLSLPEISGPSILSALKSNIFAKFSPTLGVPLKILVNSVGVGVSSISPVEVRMTPFIADGARSLNMARDSGVSMGGKAVANGAFGVGVASIDVRRSFPALRET
jgi:hypothetical protein